MTDEIAVRSSWQRYSTRNKAYLLVPVLLTLFVGLVFFISYVSFTSTSTNIKRQYELADAFMTEKIRTADTTKTCVSGLCNEYKILDAFKGQFILTAERYEILFFCCSVMLLVCSILTGILAFTVASIGWVPTSPFYKAAFLTMFFYTTFFGLVPKVFDHEGNAEKNITKYFVLTNLQTDIYNAVALKSNSTSRMDSVQCKTFSEMTAALKANRNLFITIRTENIPTKIDPASSVNLTEKNKN